MCGIVGIYSRKGIDKQQLKKATEIMQHRGPDAEGYFTDSIIGLGHKRLKIIDLSDNANQPMSNENGNLQIIYNGEIYNFREIRRELEEFNHKFKTNSDTEVILHAYEQWQENCLQRFNGMFAFAIWDNAKKELFLARDRAGVKPLYYYLDKDRFIFASEIKALLEFDIPRELNTDVLYDYLNYFILIGNYTLFKHIKTIPPAHFLILSQDKITAKKWWDFSYSEEQKTEQQWITEFREQLLRSIELRLIADVPIGAFISGGIDSSAIVALMNKISGQVKTFCVGSGDETELKYARLVAERFHTDHHEILITADDFSKNIEKMIWHSDMPMSWPSFIPLYFVSELSKGKATAILTGEGADELFAGYNRYRLMLKEISLNKGLKIIPSFFRRAVSSSIKTGDVRYKKNWNMLLNGFNYDFATGVNIFFGMEREDALASKIPRNNILKERVKQIFNEKQTNLLNRFLYLDFKTYLHELLMKQDKMSMAASIESRVPFLDYNMVEFAARMPANLKLKGNEGKYILKKAMLGILPQELIYQKKRGFPVPIDSWFKNELRDYVKQQLTEQGIIQEFFNPVYIAKLLQKNQKENCSLQIWAMLNFKLWYERFFKS